MQSSEMLNNLLSKCVNKLTKIIGFYCTYIICIPVKFKSLCKRYTGTLGTHRLFLFDF